MKYYNTYPTPPRRSAPRSPGNMGSVFGPDMMGSPPTQQNAYAPTTNYGWNHQKLGLGEGVDPNNYEFLSQVGRSILGQLGGATSKQIDNLYGSLDDYENYRKQAIQALMNPSGMAAAFRNRATAGAGEQGRLNAAALRSQGIQGAEGASMLDALNRAAEGSNAYEQDLYSPEKQAGRAGQAMGLSSPQAVFSLLDMLMKLDASEQNRRQVDLQDLQRQSQDSGGGLGGLFGGLLGQVTGGLDWNKILGI